MQIVKPYNEDQINAHAAKVGGKRNLREISIKTDDDYEFLYLVKKPSRAVMQAIADAEKKNNLDGIQKLMMGCVLEGDMETIENDGSVYVKLLEGVGELVSTAKKEVKKL
jgi:hypothetical protein